MVQPKVESMWFFEQFGSIRQTDVARGAPTDWFAAFVKTWRNLVAWSILYLVGPIDALYLVVREREASLGTAEEDKTNRLFIGLSLFAAATVALELSTNSVKTLTLTQRKFALQARRRLGYVTTIATYTEGRWPETCLINYCFFMSLSAAFCLTWLAQGLHTKLFQQGVRFMLYGSAAVVLGDQTAVLFALYLFVPAQLITLNAAENYDAMVRFTYFLRGVLNFGLVDSGPRMVLMQFPLAWMTGDFTKPLLAALGSILVQDVIGYRAVMCAWSDDKVSLPGSPSVDVIPMDNGYISEKGVVLIACLGYLYIISAAYGPVISKTDPNRAAFTLMILSASLAMASVLGRSAASTMFAHTIAKSATKSRLNNGLSYILSIAYGSSLGLACTHLPMWQVGIAVAWSSLILAILPGTYASSENLWKVLLFFHVLLMLANFFLNDSPKDLDFNLPLLLTMIRCLAALERPFYVYWTVLGLTSVCALTLACMYVAGMNTTSPIFNVASLTMGTVFLGGSFAVFREGKFRLVSVAGKSSQFVDHAVKQKYAAVGSALEHILDVPGLATRAPLLYSTARTALIECHAGGDICHLSAVTHKLLIDPAFSQARAISMSLREILEEWQTRRIFQLIKVQSLDDLSKLDPGIYLNIDRDLLQAVLCSMCSDSNMRVLHVRLTPNSRDVLADGVARQFKAVTFTCSSSAEEPRGRKGALPGLKQGSPRTLMARGSDPKLISSGKCLRERVCDAFGATLDGYSLTLPVALAATLKPRRSSSNPNDAEDAKMGEKWAFTEKRSSSVDELPQSDHALPSGLSFAILDDVKILRISLLRMCLQQARGDLTMSFANGASEEEAMSFPGSIASKPVDVVIVDENLEYPERLVSGTVIAKQVRARGFTKCLILHSANGHLRETLDGCFDGFIEKTSKREEFMQGLLRAWRHHLERVRKPPAKA